MPRGKQASKGKATAKPKTTTKRTSAPKKSKRTVQETDHEEEINDISEHSETNSQNSQTTDKPEPDVDLELKEDLEKVVEIITKDQNDNKVQDNKEKEDQVVLTKEEFEELKKLFELQKEENEKMFKKIQDEYYSRNESLSCSIRCFNTKLQNIDNRLLKVDQDTESTLYMTSFTTGIWIGLILLVFFLIYFGSMSDDEIDSFSFWNLFFKIYMFILIVRGFVQLFD